MILVTRKGTEKQFIELNNIASRDINGSLEVRVGVNPEELDTRSPIHDRVF